MDTLWLLRNGWSSKVCCGGLFFRINDSEHHCQLVSVHAEKRRHWITGHIVSLWSAPLRCPYSPYSLFPSKNSFSLPLLETTKTCSRFATKTALKEWANVLDFSPTEKYRGKRLFHSVFLFFLTFVLKKKKRKILLV